MSIAQTVSTSIVGISSMATRNVLAELIFDYERISGQRVTMESVGGVTAAERVKDGELFDVVVLASDVIDRLIASGHIAPSDRIDLARSGIAVAVMAGAQKVDISNEAKLREAMLAARSIGFSTGPSGLHLAALLERWGIAGAVESRMVQAPPGIPVGTLLANGDVELGIQQLSELLHVPGIDVLGLLPSEIQLMTTFSAALCKISKKQQATKAFLAFLTTEQTATAKRRNGMEPA